MSTLSDLNIAFSMNLMAKPNSADGTVPIRLSMQDKAVFAKAQRAIEDGWRVAYQDVSMAASTAADVDLTAFVDQLSGDTLNFAFIHMIIAYSSTEDSTALLTWDAGTTNGFDIPGAWLLICYGKDSDGDVLPSYIYNPNTNTTYDWATSGSKKTINAVAANGVTATTITGRLIVIGRV